MTPIAEPVVGHFIGARIRAGARVLAGVGLAATLWAMAANGAEPAPSVDVDMTALDQLGPPRPVAPGQRLVLHRPAMATTGTPEKPAAMAKQPATRTVARTPEKPARMPEKSMTPKKSMTPEKPTPAVAATPSADNQGAGQPAAALEKSTPATKVATAEPGPEKTLSGTVATGKIVSTRPDAGKTTGTTNSVATVTGDGTLRITFVEGSATLPDSAREPLAALASKLKADPGMRLRLIGFARGDEAAARRARRLALSRALAVRLYLTQQGIGGTRTRVQAQRVPLDNNQADRVDVAVIRK